MTQPDTPEADWSSFEQAIDDDLRQALDANDPDVKNYHIRSALQYRVIRETNKQRAQSQTDQPQQAAQLQTDQP